MRHPTDGTLRRLLDEPAAVEESRPVVAPAPASRWRAALRSPVVAALGVVALLTGASRGRRGLAADLPHRANHPGHGHPGRPGRLPDLSAYGEVEVIEDRRAS
jgi:hypothetical protein